MTQPLSKIRVLDLTNVLAGPFCCHQLAFMGADVIKVEVPGSGDLARQLGADPELNQAFMGVSFLAQNSGKRSITVNLKTKSGKNLLKQLVQSADVLVENFRPGVMQRLDVGYEVLKNENPNLVYCAISGFGQDGPLRDLPAYDQIIQGMSGVMSITGDSESAPLRAGYPIADSIGGLTAAFAISAALADQTRKSGCFIDISMLESTIATMGWVASNFLIAGKTPQPFGNNNFTASPSGTFKTGAGLINIAANKQEQFIALCRVLNCPELIDDPRFAARQARLDHRSELNELLEQALAPASAAHWCEALNAAGVPAGEVLSLPEILDHPQIADRGIVKSFAKPDGVDRDISLLGSAIKLDGKAPDTRSAPPRLGADTDAILTELGFSTDEISRLKEEKAV